MNDPCREQRFIEEFKEQESFLALEFTQISHQAFLTYHDKLIRILVPARSSKVDDHRGGDEIYLVSLQPHPPAEVHLLKKHEICFIHETHFI